MPVTATLKLAIEFEKRITANVAEISGKLGDLSNHAQEARAALAAALAPGPAPAKEVLRSLAQETKQAEGELSRYRKEQEGVASSSIRLATVSKEYEKALALIKGQLSLTEAGTKKYNDLLIQQQQVMNKASRESDAARPKFDNLFKGMLSTAAGIIAANIFGKITDGLGSVGQAMVGGNADFEQYQNQFKQILGSADAATVRLKDLSTVAKDTPFELPDLVQGDIILQNFGLHSQEAAARFGVSGDQIRTIVGDTASFARVSFSDMSTYLGKFSQGATGEALERLTELGVTSRGELTKLGVEFSKSGELMSPLPEAMTILLNQMKTKYGGLMDDQSKTLNGMVSNLKDWLGETAREAGKPIFDHLKQGLKDLLAYLNSDEGKKRVQELVSAFTMLIDVGIKLVTFVANNFLPVLTGVGVAFVGMKVAAMETIPSITALGTTIGATLLPLAAIAISLGVIVKAGQRAGEMLEEGSDRALKSRDAWVKATASLDAYRAAADKLKPPDAMEAEKKQLEDLIKLHEEKTQRAFGVGEGAQGWKNFAASIFDTNEVMQAQQTEIKGIEEKINSLRPKIDQNTEALEKGGAAGKTWGDAIREMTRANDVFTSSLGPTPDQIQKANESLKELAKTGPDALHKLSDLQRDFNADMASMNSDHLKRMHSLHNDAAKDLAKLYEDTGKKIAAIQQDYNDKRLEMTKEHTSKLHDIDQDALEKAKGLIADHNRKAQEIWADGQEAIEESRKDHEQKLADYQRDYGEKRVQMVADQQRSIDDLVAQSADQQASLLESHQEKLTELADQAAEQRERLDKDHGRTLRDLQEQLAAETDADRQAAIQTKIDKEQRGYEEEIADLDAATAKKQAKEEADYAKREAKLKEQNDKRLAALQAANARALAEQEQALQKEIALENEAQVRKEADTNSAVQKRLSKQVETLNQELADAQAAHDKQRDAENQGYDEALSKLQTATDKEIEQQRTAYATAYQDRIAALKDQRDAEDAAFAERASARQQQYDAAHAAEEAHLGELLQMQVNAQVALGNLTKDEAESLNGAIAEKYGVQKDEFAEHWKQMSEINSGGVDALKRSLLGLPPMTTVDVNVRMRVEELAAGVAGSIAGSLPVLPGRPLSGDPSSGLPAGGPGRQRVGGGPVIPMAPAAASGSSAAASGGGTTIINVDARGATMTQAQFETSVRRVMNETAAQGMARGKTR